MANGAASVSTNTPPQVPDSITPAEDSLMRLADAARVQGGANARVWMIMMSDFQCPVCREFHETVYPRIKKDYVDRGLIKMAYVNFPLSYHQHARETAERALCAGLQGKFWEFHDALFNSAEKWEKLPVGTPFFDTLAVQLKLNMTDMQACLAGGVMKQMVSVDELRSEKAGVEATPTFLIGGTLIRGIQSYDVFRKALDAAIASASG
jgi:protein-disulfide isomerase